MTFDAWWNTLTIKEQTVLGKNNARFVWQQACEACAKVCEENADDGTEGEWDSACISCADHIRARGQA